MIFLFAWVARAKQTFLHWWTCGEFSETQRDSRGVLGNWTHPGPQTSHWQSTPFFTALICVPSSLFFFFFSFPTLIFPAVDAWESPPLLLSNQAFFASRNAFLLVC